MKEMTCGECVHFEGGGRLVKKFWLYCPFKMTGTEARSIGCGEGERKPKEKYDGWVIKSYNARTPFLIVEWFGFTRKEAIEKFERAWGEGEWRKERRRGNFEVVKVKAVEVSD